MAPVAQQQAMRRPASRSCSGVQARQRQPMRSGNCRYVYKHVIRAVSVEDAPVVISTKPERASPSQLKPRQAAKDAHTDSHQSASTALQQTQQQQAAQEQLAAASDASSPGGLAGWWAGMEPKDKLVFAATLALTLSNMVSRPRQSTLLHSRYRLSFTPTHVCSRGVEVPSVLHFQMPGGLDPGRLYPRANPFAWLSTPLCRYVPLGTGKYRARWTCLRPNPGRLSSSQPRSLVITACPPLPFPDGVFPSVLAIAGQGGHVCGHRAHVCGGGVERLRVRPGAGGLLRGGQAPEGQRVAGQHAKRHGGCRI